MADTDKIKQYQKSVFDKMPADEGPADKKFVTTSKTGIPITKAQDIAARNQKWATDLPLLPFQVAGNLAIPFADPFGKKNYWLNHGPLANEEQKKIQEARELQSDAFIKRKEEVIDELSDIFDIADKRSEENPEKAEEISKVALQAKNQILSAAGLQEGDLLPVGADTYELYDEFGLFSNEPNPYPVLELGMYMGAGTAATLGGFANPYWGANVISGGLIKKFVKGAGKGFVKGKGPWQLRLASGVVHGALAVGAADFGYEVVLDAMSKAGRAKKFLSTPKSDRSEIVNAALGGVSELIPERLTFGPEGINRPDLTTRKENAVDAALTDAAISTIFFGIRPAYIGLKSVGGWLGGLRTAGPASKVFTGGGDPLAKELWKDLGSPTGADLIAAEKRLQQFDPATPITTGVGGKAMLPWGGKRYIPAREDIKVNLLGKTLTRLANSKAFNWLGPKSNRSDEWFPELETIAGTTIGRYALSGRSYLGTITDMFQRVPMFGGPLRAEIQVAGEAQKIRAMEMIGRFAPYANGMDLAVDYVKLASGKASGFRKVAREYDQKILNATKTAGAIVDDTQLIQTAKEIVFDYSKLRGLQGEFAEFLNKHILKPKEGWKPGETLLTGGRRTVGEMYELKRIMDNQHIKWAKQPEIGKIEDDIHKLYKAFETDIGSLNKTPFSHVHKLWTEYENFLSNGMLLWGTKAGKQLGNLKRYGWNIAAGTPHDLTHLSKNLWNTLAKSTDDLAAIPENILALKNIVGEKAYNRGLGHYIANSIKNSISEVEKIQYINPDILAKALGVGGKSANEPVRQLLKKALPGPVVTDYKIFNPRTRDWENWYDDLWGKIPASKIGDDSVKAMSSRLPKYSDLEDLVTILDRIFKHGMPSQSTFLARSAVLQGPIGAMGKSSPLAGAMAAYGSTMVAGSKSNFLALVPFFGFRYLGKLVTQPPVMRNWMNAMDDTLPTVIRIRNMERLFQHMPDEYKEWTATLEDLESANRKRKMRDQQISGAKELQKGVMDVLPEVMQGVGNIPGVKQAIDIGRKPLPGTGFLRDDEQPAAPQYPDDYYTGGSDLGSSITGSNVMNPGAASALYTGDTDAALANQYGGMNQGGMVMNPVMNNQGKFVDPQKGINDNPFVQNANNKGIMGVL